MSGSRKRQRLEPYAHLPGTVITSVAFQTLSAPGHVMLANAAFRYREKRNGDISLPQNDYKEYGLSGVSAVSRGLGELIERGLLIVTRRGGRGSARLCSLYALAWLPIPEMAKLTEIDGKARQADLTFLTWRPSNKRAPPPRRNRQPLRAVN